MATRLRPVLYPARLTASTLARFPSGLRIWDTPRSALEGAQMIDVVTEPMQFDVITEQLERYSETVERLNVRYQRREGWVLAIMLKPAEPT